MTIGKIKKGLELLLEDAAESEKMLTDQRDSQFFRRIYVRSVFTTIEGGIWVLKQVCLKANSIDGTKRKITISEYIILTEKSYDLKGNGNVRVTSKTINLLDNIKYTFKTINTLFEGEINIGVGNQSWERLIIAKNIRNRITHPKNETDLNISDEEILICEAVSSWFSYLVYECFMLFLKAEKKNK